MIALLLACVGDPSAKDSLFDSGSGESGGGDSGAPDSGDSADTGDSGDTGAGDVPPGPDCSDGESPIANPFNVLAAHVVAGTATAGDLVDLHTLVEEWAPSVDGPWNHVVRGPHLSLDGVSFDGEDGVVMRQASVPDVVLKRDGSLVAIFVDGDQATTLAHAEAHEPVGPGFRGFGGLSAATSWDGVEWTAAALTMAPSPSGEAVPVYVIDPDVVSLSDGRYALYFFGVEAADLCADTPDPFSVPTSHDLYRATSDNLLDWTLDGVVWRNEGGGTDPAVWCADSPHCYAFFGVAARSDDEGETFFPVEMDMPVTPQLPDVVHLPEGGWALYYGGSEGVDVLTTTDNQRWDSLGSTGVQYGSPTAITIREEVWMWTSGPENPQ